MRLSGHLRHVSVWGRYVSSGCPCPPVPTDRLIAFDCPGVCLYHVAVPSGLDLFEFPDPVYLNCTRTALFEMKTVGVSLTNRTAFLSHVIAAAAYQWSNVHLGLPTCRCCVRQRAQTI